MVIAYHLILSCYGFWLPNDPRGSWSRYVGSRRLYALGGAATKVDTRRSVADRAHDRSKRIGTKVGLKRPAVRCDGRQARAVGRGVHDYVERNGWPVHAAALMPDHVHLVLGRRRGMAIEKAAEHIKARASRFLRAEGLHPFEGEADARGRVPTVWAAGSWAVYLDDGAAVRRAVRYVERNPLAAGLRAQRYGWVVPWVG
ncbi:MAG: transposase [Planctomycetota bacterium]